MPPEIGTTDRDQLLDEILTAYLKGVKEGRAPSRQELLDRYPDLAPELTAFFADRDYVDQLAAPLQQVLTVNPALRQGLVIDNYELLEEIGHGGMGLIFKARQRSLNRIVALKMLRLGPWVTPDDRRRFRTEADAVANLDHPHIVPIYEVGVFRGQPYFTMKLMEGGSLARAVGRGQWAVGSKGRQREAARLVATVARAVHYAHQRGILHRDLKPANILLDAQGQPHVTDFGLAKRLRVPPEPAGPPSGDEPADAVSTTEYVAPPAAAGPGRHAPPRRRHHQQHRLETPGPGGVPERPGHLPGAAAGKPHRRGPPGRDGPTPAPYRRSSTDRGREPEDLPGKPGPRGAVPPGTSR